MFLPIKSYLYHHNSESTSFADRDTLMRFHYGLGVGHVYSHRVGILDNHSSSRESVTPTAACPNDDDFEGGENFMEIGHPSDDEQDEIDEESHIGVEEWDFFEQGRDASTGSLAEALVDDMFMRHAFDYEN